MKALVAAALLAVATPDGATLLAAPQPEAADYYALKARLGDAAFEALRVATDKEIERSGASSTATARCLTAAEAEVLAGLLLAQRSTNAESFAADRAAAKAALAQIAPLRARAWALEAVDESLRPVVHQLKAARSSPDARLRELHERVAADQFARTQGMAPVLVQGWAVPLSENARRFAAIFASVEICRIDQANTAWLKADLKANGWPKVSLLGKDADHAAWLLAQHADQDVTFQREVLAQLEGLLPVNDTAPQSYAYLYDRVAVAEKRPQRYATQGRCTEAKVWEPLPVENLPNIDQVRAGVGLGPLAEYRAQIRCG